MGNLEITDTVREAAGFDVDLDLLKEVEPTRRSATAVRARRPVSMESMATLSIAAYGYGIRYDHGLFRQRIKRRLAARNISEDWLALGQPLGVPARRGRLSDRVRGRVEAMTDRDGTVLLNGVRPRFVLAVAYDTPIVGWRGQHREHAFSVVGEGVRSALDAFQPRRLRRRGGGARQGGGDLRCALPLRR